MVSSEGILSSASAYVGIVGIIFSIWYSDMVAVLAKKRPIDPRNAGPYKSEVLAALLAKAIPIGIFLGAYAFAAGEVTVQIVMKSDFVLFESWGPGKQIDVFSSLLIATYFVILWFLVIDIVIGIRLLHRYWHPISERKKAEPRVH